MLRSSRRAHWPAMAYASHGSSSAAASPAAGGSPRSRAGPARRAWSHCRFVPLPVLFIPDLRRESGATLSGAAMRPNPAHLRARRQARARRDLAEPGVDGVVHEVAYRAVLAWGEEDGPLGQGVQAGDTALRTLHVDGVEVREQRPRGLKWVPRAPPRRYAPWCLRCASRNCSPAWARATSSARSSNAAAASPGPTHTV